MRKRKSSKLFGLMKSRKSPHANWAVDMDYIEKLTPQEKRWLSQFSNEFYRSAKGVLQDPDQSRERWRAYKANARDIMGLGDAVGARRGLLARELATGRVDAQEDSVIEDLDAKYAKPLDLDDGEDPDLDVS